MANIIKPKYENQTIAETEVPGVFSFDCPGCGHSHSFNNLKENEKDGFHTWEFNGDLVSPTISPSLLYRGGDMARCHSFITAGIMMFCADSTHSLAARNIPLKPYDYSSSEVYWNQGESDERSVAENPKSE